MIIGMFCQYDVGKGAGREGKSTRCRRHLRVAPTSATGWKIRRKNIRADFVTVSRNPELLGLLNQLRGDAHSVSLSAKLRLRNRLLPSFCGDGMNHLTKTTTRDGCELRERKAAAVFLRFQLERNSQNGEMI